MPERINPYDETDRPIGDVPPNLEEMPGDIFHNFAEKPYIDASFFDHARKTGRHVVEYLRTNKGRILIGAGIAATVGVIRLYEKNKRVKEQKKEPLEIEESPFDVVIHTPIKQKATIFQRTDPGVITPDTAERFMQHLEEHPHFAHWFETLGIELNEAKGKIEVHASVFITEARTLAMGFAVGTRAILKGRPLQGLIDGWHNRKTKKTKK